MKLVSFLHLEHKPCLLNQWITRTGSERWLAILKFKPTSKDEDMLSLEILKNRGHIPLPLKAVLFQRPFLEACWGLSRPLKWVASFPLKDQCFSNNSNIYIFKNYSLLRVFIFSLSWLNAYRLQSSQQHTDKRTGWENTEVCPKSGNHEVLESGSNPGVSASEIWVLFNPHSHLLSYSMPALVGEWELARWEGVEGAGHLQDPQCAWGRGDVKGAGGARMRR